MIDTQAPALFPSFTQELFRSALESLAEGIILTDDNAHIVFTTARVSEIVGYSQEEMLGRGICELLGNPEDRIRVGICANRQLTAPAEIFESRLVLKNGAEQWVIVRTTPMLSCSGASAGTLWAIDCIQQQKELESKIAFWEEEHQIGFEQIIGTSRSIKQVLAHVATVAPTDASVLITGESGTGKELIAHAVHTRSKRAARPFVRVNCASIPRELFESEFFGHVRGAFTSAIKDRIGRFQLADGGTLFLDEIGEIPIDLQGKLLRALQDGQFERVGEDYTRSVNVRVVAATNRDLKADIAAGRFRLDLYHRLSVFPIHLPALSERTEDIPALANHFLEQACKKFGYRRLQFSLIDLERLKRYRWPGNIRELQHEIERAVILGRGLQVIFSLQDEFSNGSQPAAAPRPQSPSVTTAFPDTLSLDQLEVRERELIEEALRRSGGKIYGNDGAAALLQVKPSTLQAKIKRHGIGGS